jgi:hypothetical protein
MMILALYIVLMVSMLSGGAQHSIYLDIEADLIIKNTRLVLY